VGRFTQPLENVVALGIQDPTSGDELAMALVDKNSIKDVHQGLVDKKCLKQ
jgi:hypothetical protein